MIESPATTAAPKAQLFIVVGAGGVGKTTTAAAPASSFAKLGHRTVVITVDPAKRLAQALGLDSLSNIPREVLKFENGGSLSALWLDSQQFLEELVTRHTSSPETAHKILNNRLFKIIQSQLGGIEEYLGIEKVINLGNSQGFDICVLDTPPSRHALDFLESPRHILKFFDKKVLSIFLNEEDEEEKKGGFFGFKKILGGIGHFGGAKALQLFRSFLGVQFLSELSELLKHVKPVYELFMKTAHEIEVWVKHPSTRFVAVSLLEPQPLDEIRLLGLELMSRDLHRPHLLVLNKCLPQSAPPSSETLAAAIGPNVAQKLTKIHQNQQKLREKLHSQKASGLVIAEVLRYSARHLSKDQLLEMGTGITGTWLSQDPQLFSKP